MENKIVELYKRGFSIDYIINYIYKLENRNSVSVSRINNKYIIDDSKYVSKDKIRSVTYTTIYKKFYKNTALSNKRYLL